MTTENTSGQAASEITKEELLAWMQPHLEVAGEYLLSTSPDSVVAAGRAAITGYRSKVEREAAAGIRTWQERTSIPMPEAHEMRFSMRLIHEAKDAEIADLRAALAESERSNHVLTEGLAEQSEMIAAYAKEATDRAALAAPQPSAEPAPADEIAGVNIPRLLRNLDETSYNEGSEALACRLSDCREVIKALLAAQPAPAPLNGQRCPHCDDTGDVTRADGEWLGNCDCHAAAAPLNSVSEQVSDDSKRLDWLEQEHAQTYRFKSTGHWRIFDVYGPRGQAPTLRAAIDEAMTATPSSQKGTADE